MSEATDAEKDALRLEKLFRAVRESLDTDHGIEQLTMAFGDAPADCNCREAHCPHEPFAPGISRIREMVDAAPIGWTYADLHQKPRG